MFHKFLWAWNVLRSKAYCIATDKAAVCSIPLRDPEAFDTHLQVALQHSSLVKFRDKINEVIALHEQEMQLLQRQEKRKSARKRS